ncbi:hypothetical protein BKA61DRAFT_420291, partial [Leptodontidium sp. MPI-SDFR-AT-0119]
FIKVVNNAIGPKGVMLFREHNHHSCFLPLLNLSTNFNLKRIILGNPLVALAILKHYLKAGLAVQVE